MLYLKMYEDYEYNDPLFMELSIPDYINLSKGEYINFDDYHKKDLIKLIKSKLPSIFGHNYFLTKIDRGYVSDKKYGIFDIIERKHLPFTISLRVTEEDWFIVKLIYYCHQSTYLCWKCDGLKGFIAFLKHLTSQPKKDEDWVGKNSLINPFSVEFGSKFTYTEEQLKKLIDKLDINPTFNIKLDRKKEPGNAYPTWELVIGDMLYLNISYVSSINCFSVRSQLTDLYGNRNKGFITIYTCFTEVGLYYLLEKEYGKLEGMYHV